MGNYSSADAVHRSFHPISCLAVTFTILPKDKKTTVGSGRKKLLVNHWPVKRQIMCLFHLLVRCRHHLLGRIETCQSIIRGSSIKKKTPKNINAKDEETVRCEPLIALQNVT